MSKPRPRFLTPAEADTAHRMWGMGFSHAAIAAHFGCTIRHVDVELHRIRRARDRARFKAAAATPTPLKGTRHDDRPENRIG